MKAISTSGLLLVFVIICTGLFGQSVTNKSELVLISKTKTEDFKKKKSEALRFARKNKLPVVLESKEGIIELMFLDDRGKPQYYTTNNVNAAATISTNKVTPGGSYGLNLTGSGMTIREWDAGGVLTSHQEFGSRVVQVDNVNGSHYHATHVAGILLASGVNSVALGMASNASLRAFDWNNDEAEMATEAANGALISNHSYGFLRGWNGATWWGDPDISDQEDYKFGFYDSNAKDWDDIAYNAPYYLIVKSSGNDRNDCGDGTYPCDGPYDCIEQHGIAKNILTVGAVNDIPSGYTKVSDVVMSGFSSWGPADDGRIKPDIVANGVSVFSTDNSHDADYRSLSGTSMSTPSVAGSLLLLQQYYESLKGTGVFMKSATLKALAIHTADEAGNAAGPDYAFGWGLMNTYKAARKITEDTLLNVMDEVSINNNSSYRRTVTALGGEPLQVTIVWTDLPGIPVEPSLDPEDRMLINDLDLKITKGSTATYYPWNLDKSNPEMPATKDKKNHIDNVEMVTIDNPVPGETYTITVDHDSDLAGGFQDFSIILSGISPPCDISAASLPYFQGFEAIAGITKYNGSICGPTFYWTFETDHQNEGRARFGTYAVQKNTGNGALTLDRQSSGEVTINTATLTIDLSEYTGSKGLDLSFAYVDHADESDENDKVWIRGRFDDPWLEIYDLDPSNQTNGTYQQVSDLDIDAVLSSASPPQQVSSTFQLRFGQQGINPTSTDGISFDDILIENNCLAPIEQTVFNYTNTTVDLLWTENSNASQWEIMIGPAGFDTTGFTPLLVTSNPVTWSGLTSGNEYDWYVRSVCNNGKYSEWSGPHTFTFERLTRKAPYVFFNGNNIEMELHWQLYDTYPCTVDWGTDLSYTNTFNSNEYGSDHQHKYLFSGLAPSTKYYYKVTFNDRIFYGNFVAAPSNDVTDISFFAYGDHRTFPERHDSVVDHIVEMISSSTELQTFILSAGDLISNGNYEADWDNELFIPDYPNIREMLRMLPFQATMGNHEKDGILFAKYLPYPFADGGGADGNYWSFDYGPVHIAIIDQYADYSPGSDQLNWLENDLANSDKSWKVISLHEPGYGAGHYPNNTDVQNYIQPLCEQYGVQLIFAGHSHYYARATVNDVVHITTGGGGSNLYDPDLGFPYVDTAVKAYHFCKVDIVGDLLHMVVIDRDGDTIDELLMENTFCAAPSDLITTNIKGTSAKLGWTENGEASLWDIRLGVVGFDTTDVPPFPVFSNPFNWSGLTTNTTYEWYVRANCGEYSSNWVKAGTFTTKPCNINTAILPYFESFETLNGIARYNGTVCGQSFYWTFNTSDPGVGRAKYGSYAYLKNSGNGAITLDRHPNGDVTTNSITLNIDLSNYAESEDLELSFAYADHSDENDNNDKVWVRRSQQDEWVELFDLNPDDNPDDAYLNIAGLDIDAIMLAAIPPQTVGADFQLRFGQEGSFSTPFDGFSFDDISISVNPAFDKSKPIGSSIPGFKQEGEIVVFSEEKSIIVKSDENASKFNKVVWIFDIFGRLIKRAHLPASSTSKVAVNCTNSYLVVKVLYNNKLITKKVFVY